MESTLASWIIHAFHYSAVRTDGNTLDVRSSLQSCHFRQEKKQEKSNERQALAIELFAAAFFLLTHSTGVKMSCDCLEEETSDGSFDYHLHLWCYLCVLVTQHSQWCECVQV